jgi:YVTN family beta-propeller protein
MVTDASGLTGTFYVLNGGDGTNPGSVTPITDGIARAPITVGVDPVAVAITPDGATAYVADTRDSSVYAIDTATGTATKITAYDGYDPNAIAITKAAPYVAYVVNGLSGTVSAITPDPSGGYKVRPIGVGTDPDAIAITPDGSTAYVANAGDNTVTPITTSDKTARQAITVGSDPDAIAITPDGKTAYVANAGTGTVTPITVGDDTAVAAIPVGNNPDAIAISPDGATIYVANDDSGTVSVIGGGPALSIPVGNNPDAIAISGAIAYVVSEDSGTVTPITDGGAGPPITAGSNPDAIAISADGATAYVANKASGTVTPISIATGTAGAPITVGADPDAIAAFPPAPVPT